MACFLARRKSRMNGILANIFIELDVFRSTDTIDGDGEEPDPL